MAPALCEQQVRNGTSENEKTQKSIVGVGEETTFGDVIIKGTVTGFTLQHGPNGGVESVGSDDTDEGDSMDNFRRIFLPTGTVYIKAI
jgi:hypothetical protein